MSFKQLFPLLILTLSTSIVKGNQQVDTLADPGSFNFERSELSSPQHSVPTNSFYHSLFFNYGKSPFSVTPSNLRISFPYQRVPGDFVFEDSLHFNGSKKSIPAFTFGIEAGKVNGIFGKLVIAVYDTKIPNNSFGHNMSFEFALGKDFQLGRGFAFKPSMGMAFNDFSFNFEHGIDNHLGDVMAFDRLFPYRYTGTKTKTQFTNEAISISMEDMAFILKPNLALAYKLNKNSKNCFVIQANVGYSMFVASTERIVIDGAPKSNVREKLDAPGLSFASDVSPHHLFDYQGLSWGVGISYAINYGGQSPSGPQTDRLRNKKIRRNQSGVTRYSDHPK